ncbi:MAG: hypothetical protein ABIK79_16685 [Chloroflexota bacterium]
MGEKPVVFRESDWNNLELVRQIVLYRLKHDSNWNQFDYVWEEPGSSFVEFEERQLGERFVVLANEVMWQLLMQGVITPGMNASNPTLPRFRVTDHGQEVLEAERFIPHDPTGYLDDLRAASGAIATDVNLTYVEEALRCFNAGCHVASVLLLGIAAESIFNHLCDMIRLSLKNRSEQKKLDSQLPVKPRHRWIVQKYQHLPKSVQREQLPESLDMTLGSLYDLIRRQRNELGHPQEKPPELSREQAFVFFRLFPGFVGDVQAFAEYCQQSGL